jgi:dynein heavy chain
MQCKDVAKAVGKFCVILNCNEHMGVLSMSSYLNGLAATGAWGLLDDIDRMAVEVLSVVAQSLMVLQVGNRRTTKP